MASSSKPRLKRAKKIAQPAKATHSVKNGSIVPISAKSIKKTVAEVPLKSVSIEASADKLKSKNTPKIDDKTTITELKNWVKGTGKTSKSTEESVIKSSEKIEQPTQQKQSKQHSADELQKTSVQEAPLDAPSDVSQNSKPDKFFVPIPKIRTRKKSFFRKISIVVTFISLVVFAVGFYTWRQIDLFAGDVFVGSDTGDIVSVLTAGFASNPQPLAGQNEGRTNILLIGKDSAAGLTDTIMIASYYHETGEIATVNIPRDFWVRPSSLWGVKVNAVHPFAESQYGAGQGGKILSEFLSGELAIPIHYWLMVNFDGLKSVIDEIGGIEVDVDKYLIDCQYPTDNYSGYMRPCPEFTVGKKQMDGRTALIYSRSRYSTSDFDRSRRQSKVVEAILTKVRSQMQSGALTLSPNRVAAFLQIFGGHQCITDSPKAHWEWWWKHQETKFQGPQGQSIM